jgi:hypothetical protein
VLARVVNRLFQLSIQLIGACFSISISISISCYCISIIDQLIDLHSWWCWLLRQTLKKQEEATNVLLQGRLATMADSFLCLSKCSGLLRVLSEAVR